MKTPDFLVIGHVTQDTIIQKNINYQTFGGTSLYSAILAREFGLKTAMFTSAKKDFPFNEILKNVVVKNIVSENNTEFNIFSGMFDCFSYPLAFGPPATVP